MYKTRSSKNITVYTDQNTDGIINKAGNRLNEILYENKLIPILLMVSGGSSFKLLNKIEKEALSKNVTITVLDERYSTDPAINTFFQLTQTVFYQNAIQQQCNFIETIIEPTDTLEQSGERFEFELHHWFRKNPQGLVYITQGMGADGHTAGMMPYPEDLQLFETMFINTDKWIIGYDAGNKNQYPLRITVTIPFLIHKVEESIVFISGREKNDALERALSGEGTLAQTPAQVMKEMKKVEVYNDII
jgi:6-phosphogluconolactonase/glucosamine-6-phosphate isomerase/deaminase